MRIYAFDFDGTLTTRDTFVEFIRFVRGDKEALLGFLRFSLLLILMKLGVYPNGKCKRQVFTHFFKNMPVSTFDDYCQRFARERSALLRQKGVEAIRQAQAEGSKVVVVSASPVNWVQPFLPDVEVIGTQIEVMNDKLTGRFASRNCYGEEKVRRLLERFPERNTYELIAYGDSKGDHQLLDAADEGYYKPFRR
ncbi:MAG: haloacid dehalogenase-like hydrolase [Prevotella sp.]|nr:haloacid dehalogenase-like hydrolase [Prevotella sp.]MBQ9652354.1 haloacid dehalogenase-like hydrolase [Prevotella sp.]